MIELWLQDVVQLRQIAAIEHYCQISTLFDTIVHRVTSSASTADQAGQMAKLQLPVIVSLSLSCTPLDRTHYSLKTS